MSAISRVGERWSGSRALRRRAFEGGSEPPRAVYQRGRLRIDFDAYEVWVDGRPVHLMRREFQLLRFFVQSLNRVFDRTHILAHVWPGMCVNPRTVDVHVYRLRRCIERDPMHPELLVTVRGVGWKFDERPLLRAHEAADSPREDFADRSAHHGSW
jgi:two-component system response regulator RegX3